MHKVLHVIGARPQFIKAAMVSRAMRASGRFTELFVHTGQHFDDSMSGIFFKELELPKPHYNLGIDSLSHGAMTGRMTEKLERIMMDEKPEWVVVYGDTNSTLAGALAASKLSCRLVHVEAGLRSHNLHMPEELNRIVTDRLSSWLFCPTEKSVLNLKSEGFDNFPCKVIRSGDVMLDASLHFSAEDHAVPFPLPPEFVLCTLHREGNADDTVKLRSIVHALNRINKFIPVVFPRHPRTRKAMHQAGVEMEGKVMDPVGYFAMLTLLKKCSLVMTDSGGLQKEACFFNKPCVILREETEWPELTAQGCSRLAGADEEKIFLAAEELLKQQVPCSSAAFGDGNAAGIIVQSLLENTP